MPSSSRQLLLVSLLDIAALILHHHPMTDPLSTGPVSQGRRTSWAATSGSFPACSPSWGGAMGLMVGAAVLPRLVVEDRRLHHHHRYQCRLEP
jgi:hypothetical protein